MSLLFRRVNVPQQKKMLLHTQCIHLQQQQQQQHHQACIQCVMCIHTFFSHIASHEKETERENGKCIGRFCEMRESYDKTGWMRWARWSGLRNEKRANIYRWWIFIWHEISLFYNKAINAPVEQTHDEAGSERECIAQGDQMCMCVRVYARANQQWKRDNQRDHGN